MIAFPASLLILNGKSADNLPLRDAIAKLRDEGVEIHVRVTWEKGDAQRYVDEARQLGVATVIAGGNIHIHGTCRGIVHAGAFGNTNAYVIADHMMAMQIRIAELSARAPDYVEKPDHIERAVIKNGQIVIEPVNRNEGARA